MNHHKFSVLEPRGLDRRDAAILEAASPGSVGAAVRSATWAIHGVLIAKDADAVHRWHRKPCFAKRDIYATVRTMPAIYDDIHHTIDASDKNCHQLSQATGIGIGQSKFGEFVAETKTHRKGH